MTLAERDDSIVDAAELPMLAWLGRNRLDLPDASRFAVGLATIIRRVVDFGCGVGTSANSSLGQRMDQVKRCSRLSVRTEQ